MLYFQCTAHGTSEVYCISWKGHFNLPDSHLKVRGADPGYRLVCHSPTTRGRHCPKGEQLRHPPCSPLLLASLVVKSTLNNRWDKNGVHGQLTPWIHTTGSIEPFWCLPLWPYVWSSSRGGSRNSSEFFGGGLGSRSTGIFITSKKKKNLGGGWGGG